MLPVLPAAPPLGLPGWERHATHVLLPVAPQPPMRFAAAAAVRPPYEQPDGAPPADGAPECAVCKEAAPGETARRLPACRHVFHPRCIDPWLRHHPTCPMKTALAMASCLALVYGGIALFVFLLVLGVKEHDVGEGAPEVQLGETARLLPAFLHVMPDSQRQSTCWSYRCPSLLTSWAQRNLAQEGPPVTRSQYTFGSHPDKYKSMADCAGACFGPFMVAIGVAWIYGGVAVFTYLLVASAQGHDVTGIVFSAFFLLIWLIQAAGNGAFYALQCVACVCLPRRGGARARPRRATAVAGAGGGVPRERRSAMQVLPREPPVRVAAGGGGGGGGGILPSYEQPADGGGAPECAVCMEAVEKGETVRRLPACRHVFHQRCIDPWLRHHRTCPVCRRDPFAPPPMEMV
ncbi:hypothetical protein ACP4OV_009194 [Aristida adscensionis]